MTVFSKINKTRKQNKEGIKTEITELIESKNVKCFCSNICVIAKAIQKI